MATLAPVLLVALALGFAVPARSGEQPPLVLSAKIPLGDAQGRMDHFALDEARGRLFLAELGNDSVAVIDLTSRKLAKRISGLAEPQGVGFDAASDTLYVANAGDGAVRLFKGEALAADGRIALGDDADNIRLDTESGQVFVGYGSGAIAAVNPARRTVTATYPLHGHPEGFQLDPAGGRIFVNVPGAGEIAVIELAAKKQSATWRLGGARANFPMAFDAAAQQVIAALRDPPTLMVFAASDGDLAQRLDLCADADDVFIDAKRHRLYVSCGEGVIDVFAAGAEGYVRSARIPTIAGARTAFFAAERDELYLAARAAGQEPAAVWVFKPSP